MPTRKHKDNGKASSNGNNAVVVPFTLMADVRRQKAKFLGLGIAFGELNLLDGDPGTNKSSLTLVS